MSIIEKKVLYLFFVMDDYLYIRSLKKTLFLHAGTALPTYRPPKDLA